jgi:acyl carrier protein
MNTSKDSGAEINDFLGIMRPHLKLLDPNAELEMSASLESLGLDSASALSLMLDLEDKFEVMFDESLFTEETFASAQSLWDALAKLRNA